jgi:hypothetical protein
MDETTEHVERFIDAFALGEIADQICAERLEQAGLNPSAHYDSPILAITAAEARGTRQ